MTRVNLDAVADGGNTADGSVWIRRTTHIDGGVYTASTAFGGGGGSMSLSAGTSSAALGSVVFSNSNNVSFGLNGSTVTGSVLPPGGVSAGTASAQLGTVVFSNSNNVSFGLNGSTVTASATVASTAGSISVSAGTSSANLGSLVFSNSNGVSFGLNGSTVTASVATALTSQSNQAVSAANGSFMFQTLSMADSNGVSFSTGTQGLYASHNGLTSQSNQAASASNGSFTFQTLNFSNANNVTFGTSAGGIVTASVAAPGGGGSLNLSAGTTSNNLTAVTFSNANGVSFGLNGSVITGSVAAPGGGGSVNFSAGTTSANLQSVTFGNGGGVSFGLNAGTITASKYMEFAVNGTSNGVGTIVFTDANNVTFSISGAQSIVAKADIAISAGTLSGGRSSLVFSNSNGVSFGLNGSTVTASVAAGASAAMSVYAGGLSNTEHKLSFSNLNGISFGLGGAGNSQLTASHNGLTSQSNQAASASNGSFTFQTLNFSNANNVTFGTSAGGIVTASVAAPGGGAGVTVSHWPFVPWPIATSTLPLGTTGGTGGSTQITASLHVCPLVLPLAIQYGAVLMPVSFATVAGTGSATMGHMLGLYTLNGNTLSRVTSWMWGAVVSQNSVTAQSWQWWYGSASTANTSSSGGNWSATITRLADIALIDKTTETLSAGQYFLVAGYTRRSSNAAVWGTVHRGHHSVSQFTAAPVFGGATTRAMIHSLNGIMTLTTNVAAVTAEMMPASFATSIITHTGGTSRNLWPVFKLVPVL